jgi:hypothetical protein
LILRNKGVAEVVIYFLPKTSKIVILLRGQRLRTNWRSVLFD